MTIVNSTHRKRLARALASQTGINYMAALHRVNQVATAGRLPARLDAAGMQAALRILTTPDPDAASSVPEVAAQLLASNPFVGITPGARVCSEEKDQPIANLSHIYEQVTGKQGLMYISSPGSGADRYVFGEGKVCLGRAEALSHATALGELARRAVAEAAASAQPVGAAAPFDETHQGSECDHEETEYRSQDGTYCAGCGEALVSFEQLKEAEKFYLVRASLVLLRQVSQGRVAYERFGVVAPTFAFTIDSQKAPGGQDLDLRWLRDNGYLTVAPLAQGDEWSVARTTPFGDDVLMVNGADGERFTDGLPQATRTAPAREAALVPGDVVHKARPDSNREHCVVCRQRVHRVPGGQGPTWVHTDSGAVAAPGADRIRRSVFVEEGDVPRCTATSWRGGSGTKAGSGYGPGGFNRCVREQGHSTERHLDEWGNVFVLEPGFSVIRNDSQDVVEKVATEAGMVVHW